MGLIRDNVSQLVLKSLIISIKAFSVKPLINKVLFWLIFIIVTASKALASSQINMAIYIEPPYADYADGEYYGVNVDIVKLIAQKLNKTVKYTKCPFIRCMSLMQTGDVDIIVGIKRTTERAEYVEYLHSPYNIQYFPLNFFLSSHSKITIKQYKDLEGLRIGTIRGALYFDKFDQDTSLAKTTVTTYEQLIQLLLRNRIDTFIEREESIRPWVNNDIFKSKFKKADYKYSTAVGSYIAISQKSLLMKQISMINNIHEHLLESGEIDNVFSRWIR